MENQIYGDIIFICGAQCSWIIKKLLIPLGDNYEIAKTQTKFKKILLLRTTGPISTKLGTMHLWVKEIQVISNEGHRAFPRGDNYEIAKIHWWNLKIFFFRTTEPISTKLGTKHPWVTGIKVSSNEGPRKNTYWFELYSQASDVPLGLLFSMFV